MTGDAFERVHAASLLMLKEREAALVRAVQARKKMLVAQREYADSVLEASDLGIPNTKLAKSLGVSETAVRNYVKRRKS